MLSKEKDSDGDGIANSVTTYTYDENGNLIEIITRDDYDGDGIADTGIAGKPKI